MSARNWRACPKCTRPGDDLETLREDYQIGVAADGQFFVQYRADCDRCPFTFGYRYSEQVVPQKTNAAITEDDGDPN